MLSGSAQPIGSAELVYWIAYMRLKDEREAERLQAFGGLL